MEMQRAASEHRLGTRELARLNTGSAAARSKTASGGRWRRHSRPAVVVILLLRRFRLDILFVIGERYVPFMWSEMLGAL